MTRAHAAVAADVEVPAVLGGDHADILALGLGAFTGAAGDGELELVRGTQALVTVFQRQRHRHAVLHAIATPGAADAGFHRAGGLAVGVAGLEAGGDQLAPDVRQFMQLGTEEVDALAAGDLGIEVVALADLTDGDQLVRRDFAAGDARHHGIGAVLLHVGHEGVIGVLQRNVRGLGDRRVPARGQNRAHRRLADLTAQGIRMAAVAGHQLGEGLDAFDAHQRVELLTRVREVLAQ